MNKFSQICDCVKFNSDGLVPAIAQDYITGEVLMMAWMNRESLEITLSMGNATYWSRSREKLWVKGETSGNLQLVKEICIDCDGDTILLKVEQVGGAACHTGNRSCFFRKVDDDALVDCKEESFFELAAAIKEDFEVMKDRKANPKEGSYTTYLFEKGVDKILKKVGEESAEIIIAAKNNDTKEMTNEIADLMYHMSVLMVEKGLSWEEVFAEMRSRQGKKTKHVEKLEKKSNDKFS